MVRLLIVMISLSGLGLSSASAKDATQLSKLEELKDVKVRVEDSEDPFSTRVGKLYSISATATFSNRCLAENSEVYTYVEAKAIGKDKESSSDSLRVSVFSNLDGICTAEFAPVDVEVHIGRFVPLMDREIVEIVVNGKVVYSAR